MKQGPSLAAWKAGLVVVVVLTVGPIIVGAIVADIPGAIVGAIWGGLCAPGAAGVVIMLWDFIWPRITAREHTANGQKDRR